MKKLFPVLGLLLLLTACDTSKKKSGELTHYIPEDSFLILRSNNLETLPSDLKNNTFISSFSKSDLYSYFSEKLFLTQHLQPVSEVLISLSRSERDFHYIVITRDHPALFSTDSLSNRKVETLTYEDFSLQKITTNNSILYSAVTDSVFIASSSEEILKKILTTPSEEKEADEVFKKAYSTGTSKALTLFINGKEFSDTFSQIFPEAQVKTESFTSWIALDTEVFPNKIAINGIAISGTAEEKLLDVFRGTLPQNNLIAKITPLSATGFISYTYNDFDILSQNLRKFQSGTEASPAARQFFQSLNEAGIVYKENEKIVAVHAVDGNISAEALLPLQKEFSEFREIAINEISNSTIFNTAFHPLIVDTKTKYFVRLDDFFVFAESENTLQEVITEFLNGSTLGNQPFYEEHTSQLTSAASILLVGISENLKQKASEAVDPEYAESIKNLKVDKHRIAAIQFVYDNYFAHVNGIVKETEGRSKNSGIAQLFAITLDNTVLNNPQFVTNHVSKQKDIVVQDVANKLHLISSNGRLLWSKELDGPVLGEIKQVDLFKNGKLQLAFATKKTVYVIDRLGKEVSPFPLKFRDEITQPLAVFDYDNNRDYRFVVTQGREVLMYDREGKAVKGFTFKKASSDIVLPPQHIRIGTKDYILIAEKNGKLNILNRIGNDRVKVSDKFEFSSHPFFVDNGNFAFTTAKNTKITIDQNGKSTSQDLKISAGAHYVSSGKNVVTLDDNILRINNALVELPYGLYTRPVIQITNKKTYVSVTDLQESKVYVYNTLGELLPNFPIYGNSKMEIGDATNNGKPNGVVKGEDDGILLYRLK